jgi:ubiquinone biosynthesis protein UbiJ
MTRLDDATDSAPGRAGSTVIVEDPEHMNLLGLLLCSMLERRLTDSAAQKRVRRLRGEVGVKGGRMRVTLRFAGDTVVLTRASTGRPRARVEGTLEALLGVALGRGMVRSLVRGQLRARGNLIFLWRLLPLLRAR